MSWPVSAYSSPEQRAADPIGMTKEKSLETGLGLTHKNNWHPVLLSTEDGMHALPVLLSTQCIHSLFCGCPQTTNFSSMFQNGQMRGIISFAKKAAPYGGLDSLLTQKGQARETDVSQRQQAGRGSAGVPLGRRTRRGRSSARSSARQSRSPKRKGQLSV